MIILEYADRRPLYEQVIGKFRELILTGSLEADAPMPSVRSLAVDLSINPNTIQRAYVELEREGFIYSIRGKGSFVARMDSINDVRVNEIKEKLRAVAAEALALGVSEAEFIDAAKDGIGSALKTRAGKEAV